MHISLEHGVFHYTPPFVVADGQPPAFFIQDVPSMLPDGCTGTDAIVIREKRHQTCKVTGLFRNKPQFKQELIMKKCTRYQAEGTFHQVKGKIKEMTGKLSHNPTLAIKGRSEKIAGKNTG